MVSDGQAAPPPFAALVAHPLRWQLLVALARSDRRVRELVAEVDQPQNLVSYHLRLLRRAGLVTARRSSFDGRDSYYHLDLERCAQALSVAGAALHPALHLAPAQPVPAAATPRDRRARPAVLFLCTGNSARSPVAEALLRHRSGGKVRVASAGSHPKPVLHPNALRVLREEYRIAVPDREPRHVNRLANRRFDYAISLCDKVREACPPLPGNPELVHWSIADPAAAGDHDRASYPAFRDTAAEIDTRIRFLLPVLRQTAQHREM